MTFWSAFLAASVSTAHSVASLTIVPAGTPLPAGTDGRAQAVATLVKGIAGYARWPSSDGVFVVCVGGESNLAGQLRTIATPSGQLAEIRQLRGLAPTGCDLLYLGALPPAARFRLISATHGQAILSIAENDPQCRGGTMFCLRIGANRAAFSMNIDAISRSTVRIDTRVLRLSVAPDAAQ